MKKNARSFARLVFFEARKSYLNRWILLFLVLLLVVNGARLYSDYRDTVKRWDPYTEVYEEQYALYSGPITEKKMSELDAVYLPLEAKLRTMTLSREYDPNAYTYSEAIDELFFSTLFYQEMQYCAGYAEQSERVSALASDAADFSGNIGNSAAERENQKLSALFSGRTVSDFVDTRPMLLLVNYRFSTMLAVFLCLFGLCGVFVIERESDMVMLLKTSRRGGAETNAAKFTAALGFCLVACLLFFLEDFLLLLSVSRLFENLHRPIYALEQMKYSPLSISCGSYLLFSAGIRTVGVLGCGCWFLLISSLCKNTYLSFVFGGCLTLLGSLAEPLSRSHLLLKWINPIELLDTAKLYSQSRYLSFFGLTLSRQTALLLGSLLFLLLLCTGILFAVQSNRRRG